MTMKRFITFAATALAVGLSGAVAVAVPAQAATTLYACPTSAGFDTTTTVDAHSYVPTEIAAHSTTSLVGCLNPLYPPLASTYQPLTKIALYFGPLPASAFVGDVLTIRVSGTYGNFGYYFSGWVDNDTPASSPTSLAYFTKMKTFHNGETTLGNDTIDYAITVSDPAKKAQILAGDFVIQVMNIGGANTNLEGVDSVSIAYTGKTVTFDANGGTGSMAAQGAGLPTALAINTLTRAGYAFVGWNDDPNGQGTIYRDGEVFPFDVDVTLYAQWEPLLAETGPSLLQQILVTTGGLGAVLIGALMIVMRRALRRVA